MLAALNDLLHWAPVGLPAFIFLITFVVFFHELGHFLVARAFGVKVETFSIGFGRKIFGWTDSKGTEWKVSWIPLGGYVKFLGDENAASMPDMEKVEKLPAAERVHAFPTKPLYQRALIVAAGPFANFALAIVLFALLFSVVGARTLSTYIGAVSPKSPAAEAGLRAGDHILSIDGIKTTYWSDLQQIVGASTGKPLSMVVDRKSGQTSLTIQPRRIETEDIFGAKTTIMGIGVAPDQSEQNFAYIRMSPVEAVTAGVGESWARVSLTMTYLGRIFTGRSDTSQLSGPLGIASVTQQQASEGLYGLFWIAALISVSIGLVNLFPIPILDGGHLLYYGCEAVLGRTLGARVQDVGFRLGLAVMLGLMVLATWNDLVRLKLF